jgi:3'-phosphoadenosine 5'-phosphosulfate sulfotransferase (PAPS reductase)/FAD synthetase
MSTLQDALQKGETALRDAIREYEPNQVFAAFSGGTDSLVAAHALHEMRLGCAGAPVKALHINTGTGMKRTREYVRSICDRMDWDLVEEKATSNGHRYEDLVRGEQKGVPGGFPGPPLHPLYYRYLKERQIEQVHRDYKGERGGKIMLVTGIRADESRVRAGYENGWVSHHNGVVWVNMIYDVTASQKQTYIDMFDLETNPVSDVFGMSGECLCGCFDENGGRLTELKACCSRFGEMETYRRIKGLQEEVSGRYPWAWDERKPEWAERAEEGQLALQGLPGAEENNRLARMCVGCGKSGGGEP